MKKILIILSAIYSFSLNAQVNICGHHNMDSVINLYLNPNPQWQPVQSILLDMSHSFWFNCDSSASYPLIWSDTNLKPNGIASKHYADSCAIANGGSGWKLTGNSGTTPGTNFLGTTDDKSFWFKTNNTVSGWLDPDNLNTFLGFQAGAVLTYTTVTGSQNTAIGAGAMTSLTSGTDNTAIGVASAGGLTSGTYNTAFGTSALNGTSTGNYNTAVGSAALNSNNSFDNSALGYSAGATSSGHDDTYVGDSSGVNDIGIWNCFFGSPSGTTNTTGSKLVIIGANANVGSNNLTNAIALGYGATVNSSNTIQLGNSSIAHLYVGTGSNLGSSSFLPNLHLNPHTGEVQITSDSSGSGIDTGTNKSSVSYYYLTNTWTGSTHLTTLGTITSGTWHGGNIQKSYINDSIIVASFGLKQTLSGGNRTLSVDTTSGTGSAKIATEYYVSTHASAGNIKYWAQLPEINADSAGMVVNVPADTVINQAALQACLNLNHTNHWPIRFHKAGYYWIGGTFSANKGLGGTHNVYAYDTIERDTNKNDAAPVVLMGVGANHGFNSAYSSHGASVIAKYNRGKEKDASHSIIGVVSQTTTSPEGFSFNDVCPINITFQTRYDDGVTGLDCYFAGMFHSKNFSTFADTEYVVPRLQPTINIPTREAYGVILPGNNNNVNVCLDNYSSHNFYSGAYVSQAATIINPNIVLTKYGLTFQNATSVVTIIGGNLADNTTSLYFPTKTGVAGTTGAGSNSFIDVHGTTIFNTQTGSFANVYSVADSGNFAYGGGTYDMVSAFTTYPASLHNLALTDVNTNQTPAIQLGASTQYDIPYFNQNYSNLLQKYKGFKYNSGINDSINTNGNHVWNITNLNAGASATSEFEFTNATYNSFLVQDGTGVTTTGIKGKTGPNAFYINDVGLASTTVGASFGTANAAPVKLNVAGTPEILITSTGLDLLGGQVLTSGVGAAVQDSGDFSITKAGGAFRIHSGTSGDMAGDATLSSGTIAVTITGLLSTDRAFITLTSPSGTLASGYESVCTSNTLTITSVTTAGATNTLDNSTVSYFIIRKP